MASSSTAPQPPPKHATALQVVEGKDLTGQTYLVTGANSGIGLETVRALSMKGGNVIMACRNLKSAEEGRTKLLAENADAKIELQKLDLGDLKSVEQAAADLNSRPGALNCLILNAGCYNPEPRVTKDGFEATFQANHLGHYYLTELIKDKVVQSAPSRIVVVATVGHKGWRIGTTPLSKITAEYFSPTEPPNAPLTAYALSKLCNVMHARALQTQLGTKGVVACSLHPGVIKTNIDKNSWLWKVLFNTLAQPWRINEEQGAATSVYCATVSDLGAFGAGQYFADCRVDTMADAAKDDDRVEAMVKMSDQMIQHWKETKGKL